MFSIDSLLHLERQFAHVEVALHGEAGGVVRHQDLLHLVRLEQLGVDGPRLAG